MGFNSAFKVLIGTFIWNVIYAAVNAVYIPSKGQPVHAVQGFLLFNLLAPEFYI